MQPEFVTSRKSSETVDTRYFTLFSRSPEQREWLWRLLPAAFGLAAWVPQIGTALMALNQLSASASMSEHSNGTVSRFINLTFGTSGYTLVAALLAAITAFGIWRLSKGLGAPLWAAASAASIYFVLPVIGLAPSTHFQPDDAAFAAAMILAIASVAWAARTRSGGYLFLAFLLAILAAVLRPGAAWPALAVGFAAVLSDNSFDEAPWFGMFSALCWAPGLHWADQLITASDRPFSLTAPAPQPAVEAVHTAAAASVGAFELIRQSVPSVLKFALATLPLLVLAACAAGGLAIGFLLGKARRRSAIAVAVALIICILGALGYANFQAARLLLDPLFLAGATSGAALLPHLIKRLQNPEKA